MEEKMIIVMVGLPARGKSFTSNNLCRFFNWCGIKSKVFNSGEYRRKLLDGFQDSNFFDFNNKENYKKKEEISEMCFQDLLEWLDLEGKIGIFDATNSDPERRNLLIKKSNNNNIIFLELISTDENIIKKNLELKLLSPDYIDKDKQYALSDFKKRLNFYQSQYKPIDDTENIKYIKIINFTEKLLIKNIYGINESLLISYLMNLRLNKYPIYLTRHGQSLNNIKNIIGGDCILSDLGYKYRENLHNFIKKEIQNDFVIFTSCLKRTKITAELFTEKKIESRLLNEIHGGICENLSYEEIKQKYPDISKERNADKLRFRYPEGESYLDLIERLKYFVLQLNSYNKPILIVAHNAIIRVLLGYFQGIPHEEIPYATINLHEVIKLTPNSKNYIVDKVKLI